MTGFDYGELPIYAIGVVNGLGITLIYTDVSEAERRIISAWRAELHERKAPWESVGYKAGTNWGTPAHLG